MVEDTQRTIYHQTAGAAPMIPTPPAVTQLRRMRLEIVPCLILMVPTLHLAIRPTPPSQPPMRPQIAPCLTLMAPTLHLEQITSLHKATLRLIIVLTSHLLIRLTILVPPIVHNPTILPTVRTPPLVIRHKTELPTVAAH